LFWLESGQLADSELHAAFSAAASSPPKQPMTASKMLT
jgi:hypothetical protein